jgi:hypothetical protein
VSHPAKTEEAVDLRDQVAAALAAAEEIQKNYPNVADYRLTGAIQSLRVAAQMTGNLATGETPGLAEAASEMMNALGYANDCNKCHGGELFDLLGHDYLGHRVANALSLSGIKTPDDLTSRTFGWLLSNTSVGHAGIDRIRARVLDDDFLRMDLD